MSGIIDTITLTISGRACAKLVIISVAAAIAAGSTDLANEGIVSTIFGARLRINLTTPLRATSTLGIRFLPKVETESIKLFSNLSKSAFSLAKPVTRLCQAAFIIEQEPWIVEAASKEVVPVIPISV